MLCLQKAVNETCYSKNCRCAHSQDESEDILVVRHVKRRIESGGSVQETLKEL